MLKIYKNISILIILSILIIINSEIIKYDDHIIMPDRPEYLVIPKFDKHEVPHWSPGNGRSFIDLSDVKIHSSCDPAEKNRNVKPPPPEDSSLSCIDATFEVLMFEAPEDKPWFDYWTNGDYCCTSDVVVSGGCSTTNLNKLIIPDNLPSAFLRSTIVKTVGEAQLTEGDISRHDIDESGTIVMIMALCDSSANPVIIDGSIESIDPYGYVPADQFGNLPFNLALTLMYLAVAAVWSILCYLNRSQIMPLQLWISAVMFIAMLETSLLYAHFIDWNENGIPTIAITVIALLFGALKRALSRILVMLVSLGYGVVKPSLGDDMNKVLFLGGSYFVLSFIYSLILNLTPPTKPVDESDYNVMSLIVFLLALIDTTFYVWIFTSVNNLMISLAARKQNVKYILYRNFRIVLLTMLVLTMGWVLYSSVIFLNDNGGTNKNWRMRWTVDSLWELIYFIIFVAIAILWAPSNNSQRYAYSIELTQLDSDDYDDNNLQEGTPDGDIDDEYGGHLQDQKDPFQGTGALDPAMATTKKA